MKNRKNQIQITDEKGNILSLVIVLLLCMTLLGAASVTLARTQLTMSGVGRRTSNSYYLARSGAEKIVDSMNKEIAIELPSLMEQASKMTLEKLLKAEGNEDGVTYVIKEGEEVDPYSGKYIGRQHENEYEIQLRQLIYDHIVKKFVETPKGMTGLSGDMAYLDVGGNVPIKITSKIYNKVARSNIQIVPEDIKKAVENLATKDEIGSSHKAAFVVEVAALTQDEMKRPLMKSRVIGSITLDQQVENNEQLLEEYMWAVEDVYPEALQSAIVSFGDLVDIFVFQGANQWSYNNPIHIISTSETIDISGFKSIPTVILCTDKDSIVTLTSSTTAEFNGLIITPGQVKISSSMVINGVIIAENEHMEVIPSRGSIEEENQAGVQVSAQDVEVNYDGDMILKLNFMDKSLQRRLYDSLNITNYKSVINTDLIDQEQGRINAIMGEKDDRKIKLSPRSVISSEQGGLQFVMRSLRKL